MSGSTDLPAPRTVAARARTPRTARCRRVAGWGTGMRRGAPGLAMAAAGVALAESVHALVPAVPTLTMAVVLGMAAAHLPGLRPVVRGAARPGLGVAAKRLMRSAIVLLGLQLSLSQVLGLGGATALMVLAVVVVTFLSTWWLGRRIGLPGDRPLLVATGYSICGASAIGAVSQVTGSDDEDVADSVAVVTLCGTLAIAVLPLLHHPLGLTAVSFGRWVGASVHDVGQVVAAAQTAGPAALAAAVLVKLMRVVLLAPLVAVLAARVRRRGAAGNAARRPPLVPLFVAGFLLMVLLGSTGSLPPGVVALAATLQGLLLAAALFALGASVHLPSLARTGGRMAALGLASWVTIAGVSYVGVLLTA
ncbi:putative sulfate exporter family transporter [Actinomadura kijaniata]|uniref:Putative integral membrane protein (TIGR00698 family) n=1 Tax=Actinomadura namibiensis TaxID=182080 RepID=A0A7W3LJ38_ACTNM|nr:putative sulfate exporter family transporter [Actinomadura namibiensis]MBA8949114.1 putative integral membrane protein (TIGR00698 family) [Actinomadura namibiensis]